jgi:SRSO17 transposase
MVVQRESTRGTLRRRVWAGKVWLPAAEGRAARGCLPVVRREEDGRCKYSLGNVPEETIWERLACMQGQRFFIERAFQDAKSESGMAHYEVRGWRGWHHHMALCRLAQLFCLKERIGFKDDYPLPSVRDIVELPAYCILRKTRTGEGVPGGPARPPSGEKRGYRATKTIVGFNKVELARFC